MATKVIIPLRFENRRNSLLGLIETGYLDQNVHNGFGRKAGYGSAAKILDSLNQIICVRPGMDVYLTFSIKCNI